MSYNYNRRNFYRPSMFGGFSFFPPVIKWLLIVNAAVFVLTYFLLDPATSIVFTRYFALYPLGQGFLPWQLITYQFMHATPMHLIFNMFFGLWMFGMEIEHIWGSRKFLFFYLACGIVAGISQLILAPIVDRPSIVIGASGAVFGVLVAFAMMFPDRYIYLYFLIPIKVKYFIVGVLLLGLFAVGTPTDVANLAHLGGAFAGFVYMLYDTKRIPFVGTFNRVGWWWNSVTSPRQKDAEPEDIVDAKVYDIGDGKEKEAGKGKEQHVSQKKIDEILDKISRGGYQSLTEEEKKILFDESKKLN